MSTHKAPDLPLFSASLWIYIHKRIAMINGIKKIIKHIVIPRPIKNAASPDELQKS
jgi:hypothetical protein